MNNFDPPGRKPGDVVLEAVVPITVDGVATAVNVASVWKASPSPWPLWIGAGLGIVAAAAGVVLRRRLGVLAGLLALAAGLAMLIGSWQFRSLPAISGPSPTLWLFPVVAVAVAGGAWFANRSGQRLVAAALVAVGGAELVLWAVRRRDGLDAAILPTNAPFWLDRAVTVSVLVVGVVIAVVAVVELVRPAAKTPNQPRL